MKRKIDYRTTLWASSVYRVFKLEKGQEIESFETDKYGMTRVVIDGKETRVNSVTLDRISSNAG